MIIALAFSAAFAGALWQVQSPVNTPSNESPSQLISEVVDNELNAQQNDHSLWCYRQIQHSSEGTEELEIVETPEGSIHRVLKRDGQPLSPEEAAREDDRIRHIVENPKDFQKQVKDEEKDTQEEGHLLKVLPSAFEFRFAGRDGDVVKLDFSPRPSFKPERREGQVFHHMVGSVFVRLPQKRLVAIQGRLVSEVKFFGGVLGYLEKGGTFDVTQADVGGGHWEMTQLHVNMQGKALFFKTISVHEDEENSTFRSVAGNLTVAEAAEILKGEEKSASQKRRRAASN